MHTFLACFFRHLLALRDLAIACVSSVLIYSKFLITCLLHSLRVLSWTSSQMSTWNDIRLFPGAEWFCEIFLPVFLMGDRSELGYLV